MSGEILGVDGMVQSQCQCGIVPWEAVTSSSVEFGLSMVRTGGNTQRDQPGSCFNENK